MTNTCRTCGDDVHPQRWLLGYRVCLLCGEEHAREERAGWTIAPMHKSNYVLLTNKQDLLGINNKGGLHR
jgi:hypothetical protein